jgi:hypothetical protein
MILPDRLSLTTLLAAGAVALAAYVVSMVNTGRLDQPAGTRVAAAGAALVPSVEGGGPGGGYLDGRPIPSGFTTPVVIRYQPANDRPVADAPAAGRAAPPAAPAQ